MAFWVVVLLLGLDPSWYVQAVCVPEPPCVLGCHVRDDPVSRGAFQVGDAVEYEEEGGWWPATVDAVSWTEEESATYTLVGEHEAEEWTQDGVQESVMRSLASGYSVADPAAELSAEEQRAREYLARAWRLWDLAKQATDGGRNRMSEFAYQYCWKAMINVRSECMYSARGAVSE
jgi:hypothetical protein